MIFRPHKYRAGQKYPTVLNIYGGPEVQLVTNTFKVFYLVSSPSRNFLNFDTVQQGLRQLRLHMLAALGYCVVTIDSRGSQNRGVQFESHIKGRLVSRELHLAVTIYLNFVLFLRALLSCRIKLRYWNGLPKRQAALT